MPKKSGANIRLVDRDFDILEHISRYQMTTREVLHRLFFSDSELNAVTKVTSRLVSNRFLNRYDLHSGKSYFVLAQNAAPYFQISAKKFKPHGPQALVQNYGILQFCCLSSVRRERLLVKELASKLGDLSGRHINASQFYVDDDGTTKRLAFMRVDHGGPPAHILRKCRADIQNFAHNPSLNQFIRKQRLVIAIITLNAAKVDAIRAAIPRQTWPISFRVEAVPDLAPLVINRQFHLGEQLGDGAASEFESASGVEPTDLGESGDQHG